MMMMKLKEVFVQFIRDEDGVTMIEYGLIAALVALVSVTAVTGAGTSLKTLWSNVSTALSTAASGSQS